MMKEFSVLLPEICENYHIILRLYAFEDIPTIVNEFTETIDSVDPKIEEGLKYNDGLITDDDYDMTIYVNTEARTNPEFLFIKLLFRVSTQLSKIMDSEEYGARIHTLLYRSLIDEVRKAR